MRSSPVYATDFVADSQVLGAIVIARNGDRVEYYQNPDTYEGSPTETTALGEVESHQLGAALRSEYLTPTSPSYIDGMRTDLVDNSEIKIRVKNGGEGTVIFDSAIALLQGLFPPNPKNKIILANDTEVVAPLGGYQYVPVETVEPSNDRSLESWTDCPAFEEHIREFYASDEFKKMEEDAQPFFKSVKDFVFGRPTTLVNALYDFMNSQLVHNKTYAYRLPPSLHETARGLANYHENGVFSDKESGGIGNIAGRTMLQPILESLERVAFNGDPLQFMLIETGYQAFISLFHELDIVKENPDMQAIPDYASAFVIELRRGSPPDVRDFLRFRFKNGTRNSFKTVYVYGTHADIPLTEFIYKAKGGVISGNKQWAQVCGTSSFSESHSLTDKITYAVKHQTISSITLALVMFVGLYILRNVLVRVGKTAGQKIKNLRGRKVQLEGEEVLNVEAMSARVLPDEKITRI
ncbi:histidine phosphatase superfamily [Rhodocollybia butyracea]|uniref:Histidine phosphatase superfamily n=1 Tax=Rhodocollybia butyracea TaxID=206335 RepID=A0A9P5P8H0_9AGAR|nr:histidine phosphatase superfamily [Rhodocollybia butyracea]